ncbi:uncharacterized protein LOC114316258 isoform X2 [Camellia sinensis]|uniref:uncharacterized protein LOC114316258 isoform X2 n=1 Tax=Camellia sinensis TaxID=4442 RepID=UPI001035537C|nr:uncharacterized protein LOC114316258 isoform X2 [Camellia sinensis]
MGLKLQMMALYSLVVFSEFGWSGRIGHDKNSCKFVSREAGRQSDYGLEMRTGVARNIGLPVEFYRHQINELSQKTKQKFDSGTPRTARAAGRLTHTDNRRGAGSILHRKHLVAHVQRESCSCGCLVKRHVPVTCITEPTKTKQKFGSGTPRTARMAGKLTHADNRGGAGSILHRKHLVAHVQRTCRESPAHAAVW